MHTPTPRGDEPGRDDLPVTFLRSPSKRAVREREQHPGALAVAGVFIATAAVVACLGVAGAVGFGIYAHTQMGDPLRRSVAYAGIVLLLAALAASGLAFFGYVLDLLVEIAENTRGR